MSSKNSKNLFPRFYAYLKPYNRFLYLGLFLICLSNAVGVFQPYLVKEAIDLGVAKKDSYFLGKTMLIIFLALLVNFIAYGFYQYLTEFIGQRVLIDIRKDMYDKLFRLSRNYFDGHFIGDVLSRVVSDVESLKGFLAGGIVSIFSEFLRIIFIAVAILFLNVYLGFITLLIVPLFLLFTYGFRRSLKDAYTGIRKANASINHHLNESINGIQEIKVYGAAPKMMAEMDMASKSYLNSAMKMTYSYSFYFPTMDLMANGILIVLLLAIHYGLGYSTSLGNVFAYFLYANMIFNPLRIIAEKMNVFQATVAAMERLLAFLAEKEEEKEIVFKGEAISDFSQDVEFKNVFFAYPTQKPLFEDFSLSIKNGEKIALIGETGSGKTSLIKLLTRLYEMDGGDILIGGKSICSTPLKKLRENIAVVLQKSFLLSESLFENIRFLKTEVSRERVFELCRELNVESFIDEMGGLERILSEEGEGISMGQRQLIAFLRTIIEDKPLVILDEASSHIDLSLERLLEKALERLLSKKTAIIIAHRLSTTRWVDKIVVLKKGKIIEMGTHEELIEKNEGYYKTLYFIQSMREKRKEK